jgi:hypothetical protein
MENISQIGIIIFGASAIWFVSRREKWRRWGYLLGILSQPFWFISAYQSKQWGIFLLSVWYTYSWTQGIWNYWIKPEK